MESNRWRAELEDRFGDDWRKAVTWQVGKWILYMGVIVVIATNYAKTNIGIPILLILLLCGAHWWGNRTWDLERIFKQTLLYRWIERPLHVTGFLVIIWSIFTYTN
ncbi:hypothetical protein [Desmospora profundinema]|uniref:Uncharacterized protein n=1 Tax=Desmospora profundinema TaxID=1571184 RepID=A0ABU1ITR2_9BACL|nr:hypothetical protein [Desmospora profundinema]MDR6227574.1 hypothetical protein [Desmospora profundinema]